MAATKRATVYLEPNIRRLLQLKAAETEKSISDLVNSAVRQSLAEDSEDLAAFDERAKEPTIAFEKVLKDLKRRGRL